MPTDARRRDRVIGLGAIGLLLLNPPLLGLFSSDRALLGVPLLYLYLFAVWAGLIGALSWAMESRGRPEGRNRTEE